MEPQHVPLRMFLLEQEPSIPASSPSGIPGLYEKDSFNTGLCAVMEQFIQHRRCIRMGSVIKCQQKAGFHNAFCFSSVVVRTLPVQV